MIAPANFTASAPAPVIVPRVQRPLFWRVRVALRLAVFALIFVAVFGWELLRALVLGNKATSEGQTDE